MKLNKEQVIVQINPMLFLPNPLLFLGVVAKFSTLLLPVKQLILNFK